MWTEIIWIGPPHQQDVCRIHRLQPDSTELVCSTLHWRPRRRRLPSVRCPSGLLDELLHHLVKDDSLGTNVRLAEVFRISQSTVVWHTRSLSFVSKLTRWVSYQLTNTFCQNCLDAAVSLLIFRNTKTWFNVMVNGDEKWVLNFNRPRKQLWAPPGEHSKTRATYELHSKMVMVLVSGESKCTLLFAFLSSNSRITMHLFCKQLDRLAIQILRKPPKPRTHLPPSPQCHTPFPNHNYSKAAPAGLGGPLSPTIHHKCFTVQLSSVSAPGQRSAIQHLLQRRRAE